MNISKYDKQLHKKLLRKFQINTDELNYTIHPYKAVKILTASKQPYVCKLNDEIVAFFVIHKGAEIEEYVASNDSALLFRSFSVDTRYRRKGVAKTTIIKLIEYLKFYEPGYKLLFLTVHSSNHKARKLYEKLGFQYCEGKKLKDESLLCMNFSLKR